MHLEMFSLKIARYKLIRQFSLPAESVRDLFLPAESIRMILCPAESLDRNRITLTVSAGRKRSRTDTAEAKYDRQFRQKAKIGGFVYTL